MGMRKLFGIMSQNKEKITAFSPLRSRNASLRRSRARGNDKIDLSFPRQPEADPPSAEKWESNSPSGVKYFGFNKNSLFDPVCSRWGGSFLYSLFNQLPNAYNGIDCIFPSR